MIRLGGMGCKIFVGVFETLEDHFGGRTFCFAGEGIVSGLDRCFSARSFRVRGI